MINYILFYLVLIIRPCHKLSFGCTICPLGLPQIVSHSARFDLSDTNICMHSWSFRQFKFDCAAYLVWNLAVSNDCSTIQCRAFYT